MRVIFLSCRWELITRFPGSTTRTGNLEGSNCHGALIKTRARYVIGIIRAFPVRKRAVDCMSLVHVHGPIDPPLPPCDPSFACRAIADRSIQWLIKALPSVYNVHVLIQPPSLSLSPSRNFNQTSRPG